MPLVVAVWRDHPKVITAFGDERPAANTGTILLNNAVQWEDIRTEFKERSWHSIVDLHWSGDTLHLIAVNDYDTNGEALADEFSDTVAAYAPGLPGYRVSIVSVELLKGNAP